MLMLIGFAVLAILSINVYRARRGEKIDSEPDMDLFKPVEHHFPPDDFTRHP